MTGEFDVLVGINLLREGLDMPEVSLARLAPGAVLLGYGGAFDEVFTGYAPSRRGGTGKLPESARHERGHLVHGRAEQWYSVSGSSIRL